MTFCKIICFLFLLISLFPGNAEASIGGLEAGILTSTLNGKLGLAIGGIISIYGLYVWVVQRNTWGLGIICLGIIFGMLPETFSDMYNATVGILRPLGGTGAPL